MTMSPQKSPSYALYRTVTANDSLPMANVDHGINMSGYKTANIQVVPDTGENPTVNVLFWSEGAGKFVQGSTAIAKTGVGASTPHEFSVDCNGRIIFVAVSGLSASFAKIYVSGFELSHPE